jgi:hypothetical protein
MKSRWLAYVLLGSVSLGFACKSGGGVGSSFLEVVETAPEKGQEDVNVETSIAVRVSEAINPATLTNATFFLADEDGAVVPSTVNILDEPNAQPSDIGTAAELTPDGPLDVLTNYTVTVTVGLQSTGGVSLEEDFQWTYTTLDAAWGKAEWVEPLGAWNSSGQQIAVDGQLNAFAVWELDDRVGNPSNTFIYANRYTRNGLWGEPEPIDDGNGRSASPVVAVDGAGNGFAVWERLDLVSSVREIWANRYDVEEGSWGTAALLQNGDVTEAKAPSVAADPSGNATAVWVQDNLDPADPQLVRAIRYAPGVGWGDAETIGPPGSTLIAAGKTTVGMDDEGGAIAVWNPPAGAAGQGGRVLWANRYTPGLGWGEVDVIKKDENTGAGGFRLDVGSNGDAFVIWIQDNGSDTEPRNDIWAVRFSADMWSVPRRIDNHDNGDKKAPDIAIDGAGMAYAVWSQVGDADDVFENIWSAQYTPGSDWLGSDWGDPVLIEPTSTEGGTSLSSGVRIGTAGAVSGRIESTRVKPGCPPTRNASKVSRRRRAYPKSPSTRHGTRTRSGCTKTVAFKRCAPTDSNRTIARLEMRVCRMTVSGDPMARFGLSAYVAPCVSRLTEGAQSEAFPKKQTRSN